MFRKKEILSTIFLLLLVVENLAYGYVSGSENYRIQRDSINFGGELSTSTNYRAEDTLGEQGTGALTGSSFKIRAGYQQMDSESAYSISLSSPSDVTMSPAINISQGGTSEGEAVWTVVTDNPGGYIISLKSSTNPSMKSSDDSLADYAPSSENPDYSWSVGESSAAFGFSPEGDDIISTYKDDGVSCGVGAGDTTDKCWDGLSIANKIVSRKTSPNSPAGSDTTVKFKATIGSNSDKKQGIYSAVITATVLAL